MKKSILVGVFCFLGSGTFAEAVERYALGAFTAQSYTCQQAVFAANNQCLSALQQFTQTHSVVGAASCPRYACSCYGGTTPAQAVCPGEAVYEDGLAYESVRRTVVERFFGRGYSCWHAMHNARNAMFQWAAAMSGRAAIVDFDLRRFGNCACNNYGTPTATCSASVTYLQATGE